MGCNLNTDILGGSLPEIGHKWYAIQTKPFQEDVSVANLRRAGIEAFNPKVRTIRYSKTILKAFFPCYIFGRFNWTRDGRLVRYTRGIKCIVGAKDRPWPIDDEFMRELLSRFDENHIFNNKEEPKAGEEVKVIGGPFKGLRGVFEKGLRDKERVVILLRTIEYQARIELNRLLIEKT